MKDKIKNFMKKRGTVSFLASIISILVGILVGFIILLFIDAGHAGYGLMKIITSGASSMNRIAKVLYQAAPLVMTGLAVAFAFKTGLFNIGASGQYMVGMFCALTAGIQFGMPWYVCLFAAMIGGAVWGAIPGICKAFFNVNEVITAIMFNWIGLYMVNLLIGNMPKMLPSAWLEKANDDRTVALAVANKSAIIPKLGLDVLFNSTYMNISIILVIIFAIIISIVLNKTTFGYELKACGYNKNASIYAGINAKRNIVLSMVISGALAGIGGGIYFLSGTAEYTLVKVLLGAGFNGIPIALLAQSNPIGVIFSALFVSYIQVGGEAMQPEFAKEIIDIIIAVIIYLSAFSLLMQQLLLKFFKRKEERVGEKALSDTAENKASEVKK